MTIYEKIKDVLQNHQDVNITRRLLIELLQKKYQINPASVIPSDYCYNRINNGIKFNKHIFQYIDSNTYKYLGEKNPYTGKIYHKPASQDYEFIVGEWINGKKIIYETPIDSLSGKAVQGLTENIFTKKTVEQVTVEKIQDGEVEEPQHFFQSVEQIHALIIRADDIVETRKLITQFTNLKKERIPFFLTQDDFNAILFWKLRQQYNRTAKHRVLNSDFNIRIVTQAAFSVKHQNKNFETELRLKMLTTLSGVEVPVASAIMALCYPEKYAVIDFRGWRQIFGTVKKYPNYTTKDYIKYLSIILRIANRFKITPQQVDMAIWQYDIENS